MPAIVKCCGEPLSLEKQGEHSAFEAAHLSIRMDQSRGRFRACLNVRNDFLPALANHRDISTGSGCGAGGRFGL